MTATEIQSLLSFEEASLEAGLRPGMDVADLSLKVGSGELVFIRGDEERIRLIADAAMGLVTPVQGRVACFGENWADLGPDRAGRIRSNIGRVFQDQAWISNLDVDENITLSQCHYTQRPVEEILEEARQIGRDIGLDDLPVGRSAWVSRRRLQTLQWVRALLGHPLLYVLEEPIKDADPDETSRMIEALSRRREAGAGALWLSCAPSDGLKGALNISQQYTINGNRVEPLSGD